MQISATVYLHEATVVTNCWREYIVANRLIAEIPPAVAKAAMESGVAKEPILDWDKYKDELRERLGNDNKLVRLLYNRAKLD